MSVFAGTSYMTQLSRFVEMVYSAYCGQMTHAKALCNYVGDGLILARNMRVNFLQYYMQVETKQTCDMDKTCHVALFPTTVYNYGDDIVHYALNYNK